MSILARAGAALAVAYTLVFALCISVAGASPAEELQVGRNRFLAGDYEAAIARFSALLYPTSRLAQATAMAEAHLLLGVSYLETNQLDSASREVEEALFLDSSLRLESNQFSPQAIEFFERTRRELGERARVAAASEQQTRRQQALDEALRNLVVLEKNRYFVNYIPFGAGQFQNGDRGKGVAFFSVGALTAGTSIGLWSYQVIKYGFRGKVPRDEVSRVNTLQLLQIGSGVLFWGFYAWGIIDSLSHYEHAVTRTADPSLLRKLKDVYKPKAVSAVRIVPMLTRESGGLSAVWKF